MGVKLRVRVAGVSGPARALEVPETCTLAQLRRALVEKVLRELWGENVSEVDVVVSLNGDEDLGVAGNAESATLRACGVTRGDLIRVKRRDVGDATDGGSAFPGAMTSTTSVDETQARIPRRDATEATVVPPDARDGDHAKRTGNCAFRGATHGTSSVSSHVNPRVTSSPGGRAPYRDLPSALARVLARESSESAEPFSASEFFLVATHAALLETGLGLMRDDDDSAPETRGLARPNEPAPDRSSSERLPIGWRAARRTSGAWRLRYCASVLNRAGEPEPVLADAFCEIKAHAIGTNDSTLIVAGRTVVYSEDRARDARTDPFDRETHALALAADDWFDAGTERPRDASESFRLRDARGFWSRVKDAFASRLRRDVAIAAGLRPPAGLLALPDDLKLAALRRIPAEDFASLCAAGSTCRELRFVADADGLWEERFRVCFGDTARVDADATRALEGNSTRDRFREGSSDSLYDASRRWKRRFAARVVAAREEEARRRERAERETRGTRAGFPGFYSGGGGGLGPGYVQPGPPGFVPGITGGDYDLYPGGMGSAGALPGFPGSRGLGGGGATGGLPYGGYAPGTPIGGWPSVPGGRGFPFGMPGGVPTPTPGGGLGNGRRGLALGSRGSGAGGPDPGRDGRPTPPGGPEGDGFFFQ